METKKYENGEFTLFDNETTYVLTEETDSGTETIFIIEKNSQKIMLNKKGFVPDFRKIDTMKKTIELAFNSKTKEGLLSVIFTIDF